MDSLKHTKATEATNRLDMVETLEVNHMEILEQLDTAAAISEVISHSEVVISEVDTRNNHTVATILAVLILWAVMVILVMVMLDSFLPK